MDTFDYKIPRLQADHGKTLPFAIPKLQKVAGDATWGR